MLLFTTQAKVAIALTLLAVWAWQNYKYHHQHNPLITNNVIENQDNHRNISRPWDTLDLARNLQAKQAEQERRAGKEKAR